MATLYDSIELLSREKGIDTQIVLDAVKDALLDRKSTRLNSSHIQKSRMPSSA